MKEVAESPDFDIIKVKCQRTDKAVIRNYSFINVFLKQKHCKKFDILTTKQLWALYIIILIIQHNYFSDLYPAKILDLSAKSFFSCKLI